MPDARLRRARCAMTGIEPVLPESLNVEMVASKIARFRHGVAHAHYDTATSANPLQLIVDNQTTTTRWRKLSLVHYQLSIKSAVQFTP